MYAQYFTTSATSKLWRILLLKCHKHSCLHGDHEELMGQVERIFHGQQLHERATMERKYPCAQKKHMSGVNKKRQ